jgi:prepilin-type processing-associated H-X9-DG protein
MATPMCNPCSRLAPADRPLDPTPPHDPLPTAGTQLRNNILMCDWHAAQFDAALAKGGSSGTGR